MPAIPQVVIEPIDHFSEKQLLAFGDIGDVIRYSAGKNTIDGSFAAYLLGLFGVERLQNIDEDIARNRASVMLNTRLKGVHVRLNRSRPFKRDEDESVFVESLTYPSEFRAGFVELSGYTAAVSRGLTRETFTSYYADDQSQRPWSWTPFNVDLAQARPPIDRVPLRASVGYALRVVLDRTKPLHKGK